MVLLIAGGTHTGKTLLAQRLLEQYGYPYLSIDHLKMGLIRSGHCPLTPKSPDRELTAYLWPVVREIIKTCLENRQNLIVEGCYIPFNYREDFPPAMLSQIRYVCLIFREDYICTHFNLIREHARIIEDRLDDSGCTQEELLQENRENLQACLVNGCAYLLIEDPYQVDLVL